MKRRCKIIKIILSFIAKEILQIFQKKKNGSTDIVSGMGEIVQLTMPTVEDQSTADHASGMITIRDFRNLRLCLNFGTF